MLTAPDCTSPNGSSHALPGRTLVRVGLAAALVSLVATSPRAELIQMNFNYGPVPKPLLGVGSGEDPSLPGVWEGYHNGSVYDPHCSLSWEQEGYSNAGNDQDQGRAIHQTTLPNWRTLPTIDNVAWVSLLTQHFGNSPGPGLDLAAQRDGTRVRFGFEGNKAFVEMFGSSGVSQGVEQGPEQLGGQLAGNCGEHAVHLIIAKLEWDYDGAGHDRVSVWVDPADLLRGEIGLGEPDVAQEGVDSWGSWRELRLSMANNNQIDALRISFNGSTPARLREVLQPNCGDGVVDEGEACDPGLGGCCSEFCQNEPNLDSDGDTVPDGSDQCPGTAPAAAVDPLGCDQQQFCALFELDSKEGRRDCKKANWYTSPTDRKRDCRVGPGAVCVPR